MSGVGAASFSARTLTHPRPSVPPFGVYQLAIPEWQDYAFEFLYNAEDAARAYLRGSCKLPLAAQKFEVNDTFAATFVERRDTRDREDRSDIQFERVLECIGNVASNGGVVAIPVGDLEWMGSRIVATFDQESVEYKHLIDHQAEITRILSEAGLSDPPVYLPHHTSLTRFKYDRNIPHHDLYRKHRETLLHMMSAQLVAAGIDSVELGETIVGRNYTDQFTLEDWRTDMELRVQAYEGLVAV